VALVLLMAVAVLPALGCRSALATVMFMWKGTDEPPEFPGLKEKKVAVVCRPLVTLQYRNASVARDLAQKVTSLIQEKVPKVKTVDQQKIAKWTDENTWEDFPEVGKAMKAEIVVGIDLESFSLLQGQTLYQGKANATIRVYDCKQGNKVVFEKTIPQSIYPPNTSIPTSDRSEAEFRREFVAVLADQIARHFYDHDRYADVGLDAASLK
jgi:hypothetical protein